MRVDAVDIYPITMTLGSPIPMAGGIIESTRNVVVKLVSSDGLVGWGEGVEAPTLTHQRQSDIVADLEGLTPIVVGSDPERRNDLWLEMGRVLPKASTAIGAIDIAIHDLAAQALGVPVHQLLGGQIREVVPALTLVGSGNAAADADKLAERVDQGFKWFKIKLGMGSPDEDVATMAKAVEVSGADGVVCGDVNEGWDEATAMSFLQRLAGMNVRFIEQPVHRADRAALLRLAERSPIRLCADESAASLEAVAGFVGTPIGGVSLKLIKHGGITGVMRGAVICSAARMGVNLAGKVIESSISAAANLHCAAAMDQVDYGCSPANQGVVLDVTEEPIRIHHGTFHVPQGPGLGVQVDESRLRRLSD